MIDEVSHGRAHDPGLSLSQYEKQTEELFHSQIHFSQPMPDNVPPKWQVNKISIFKSHYKWICKPEKSVKVQDANMLGLRPTEWKQTIEYKYPSNEGFVLLHRSAPKHIKLLFHVTLKSNPRVKRKVHAEVTIPDLSEGP